jgi:hypothetical protein
MSGMRAKPNNLGLTILAVVGLALLAVSGAAELVTEDEAPLDTDVRGAFERIKLAWEQEDQQALAEIVHPDGLRVNNPVTANRYTSYSPSQAFYYFKNLFHRHDTDAFIFRRVQESDDSPRVHALVEWTRHQSGTERAEILRLMIVLTRDAEGWGLAEINTIR